MRDAVRHADPVRVHGRVVGVVGLLIESQGPPAKVGELCWIERGRRETPLQVEVVGFRNGRTLLTPLGELRGV
ncbi:MAG: flagellum-specific ATP synthase FliI, partial [Fimbriimonadales bacterium]